MKPKSYMSYISIANPHDSATWEKMAAVKSNILKRWDTATTGVRICCVKFVQKVIQVQTPGASADPRVRFPLGHSVAKLFY